MIPTMPDFNLSSYNDGGAGTPEDFGSPAWREEVTEPVVALAPQYGQPVAPVPQYGLAVAPVPQTGLGKANGGRGKGLMKRPDHIPGTPESLKSGPGPCVGTMQDMHNMTIMTLKEAPVPVPVSKHTYITKYASLCATGVGGDQQRKQVIDGNHAATLHMINTEEGMKAFQMTGYKNDRAADAYFARNKDISVEALAAADDLGDFRGEVDHLQINNNEWLPPYVCTMLEP